MQRDMESTVVASSCSSHALDSPKSPPKKNKVERVTVRLTGELGEDIRELERITTASSPSEVVRRAIVVYHRLVKQKLAGNEPLVVVKEEGGEKTVPIFL